MKFGNKYMSRIGKKLITLPAGVSLDVKPGESVFGGAKVFVKGPKGSLEVDLEKNFEVKVDGSTVTVVRANEERSTKALHGLYRSLINNAVVGVTSGYEKKLEIQGIGYKAELVGNNLSMKLGFSHPVVVEAPEGIRFEVKDGVLITVSGIDKQMVGQVTSEIRSKRKPEPYKGKGIRFLGEVVKKKAGKAAAKTTAA